MKTIEELKAMRDVWPTVVEHIPQAINRAHNQLDQILEDPQHPYTQLLVNCVTN